MASKLDEMDQEGKDWIPPSSNYIPYWFLGEGVEEVDESIYWEGLRFQDLQHSK